MAALAGDLSRVILGQSDAAKAFRPWWDYLEDYLMYSFVLMSLVTLPMTFLSGNPVDCAIHSQYWYNDTGKVPQYTRYIQAYSKKYCTETNISVFLLYLPFSLLLAPIFLTAVEKLFIRCFNCEKKLDQFYSLLVKESLCTEEVGHLANENIKELHEIKQAFRNSSGCYKSYLYRFFFLTFWLAVLSLFGYAGCTAFNLAWLLCPRMNKLRCLLLGCKRRKQTLSSNNGSSSLYQTRLEMYFDKKSRDFSLLMDLLAESSGIVQSLRILCLFDRQFQKMWDPTSIQILEQTDYLGSGDEKTTSINVSWSDCHFADYAKKKLGNKVLEYTVEIQPETEASIKSFHYYRLESLVGQIGLLQNPLEDDHIDIKTGFQNGKHTNGMDKHTERFQKYSTRFDGLVVTQDEKYSLKVLKSSTLLDGKGKGYRQGLI
ncbi:uncharacterized protein LOC111709704 isoform X2 [Eurytemora carolleeae]|uniref:uncharacterized protein LOC111709704 isoform X2 n=1 Tax=Eurytemora carolleeae TaxID=1294199 RepID=UPI000C75B9B9|nr:uncharacterized protein LOC111709704 isoform X2 [Eurytemora carolleeae]|eukprot:XP_023339347.1 uncharacterized protein LOC111709704 isoform X2 [Eurytemora affinis]